GATREEMAFVEAKEVLAPERNVKELGIVHVNFWFKPGSASDGNQEKALVDVIDLSEAKIPREDRKRPQRQLPTVAKGINGPISVQYLDRSTHVLHEAGMVEQVHECPPPRYASRFLSA